jgi:hypothetical protein
VRFSCACTFLTVITNPIFYLEPEYEECLHFRNIRSSCLSLSYFLFPDFSPPVLLSERMLEGYSFRIFATCVSLPYSILLLFFSSLYFTFPTVITSCVRRCFTSVLSRSYR